MGVARSIRAWATHLQQGRPKKNCASMAIPLSLDRRLVRLIAEGYFGGPDYQAPGPARAAASISRTSLKVLPEADYIRNDRIWGGHMVASPRRSHTDLKRTSPGWSTCDGGVQSSPSKAHFPLYQLPLELSRGPCTAAGPP